MSDVFVDNIEPHCRLLFKPVGHCQTKGAHMDAWVPKEPFVREKICGKVPLAIFFHGGAFTIGSTHDIGFNQVKWFLEHGVACVSVEYRMLPQAQLSDIRMDLVDAYKFILFELNNAVQFHVPNAPEIDTTRCLVSGGSAGGSCALWLAHDIEHWNTISENPKAPSLRCVISAYPPVDINGIFASPREELEKKVRPAFPDLWKKMIKIYDEPVCCSEPYLDPVHDPKKDEEPRQLFLKAVTLSNTLGSFLLGKNPPFPDADNVTKGMTSSYPPTFIFCALEDGMIPVEQSFMVERTLQGLGVEVVAPRVPAPHGFLDMPAKCFPDRAQGWWDQAILPSLEWALKKLQ
ncbi:alpha/beta-hydrolase [Meredithblackwellia eburnea MCA 4105]